MTQVVTLTWERFKHFCVRTKLRYTPFFLLPSWHAVRSYWPHLRWWVVAQPLHQMVSWLRFSGVFSAVRQMSGDLWTAPGIISFITLIISDRLDWHDTLGKRPLARNSDRTWWYPHSSLKHFWLQPLAPWTTDTKLRSFISTVDRYLIIISIF